MKSFLLAVLSLIMTAPLIAADAARPIHVALIFDDGPTPGQREKFLELFKAENIHVTFGTVAKNAEANPELIKATLAAGHECANHSYSHQHPKEVDDATLAHEIVGAEEIFTRILGTAPAWYWPPFIELDPRMPPLLKQAGLKIYTPRHLVGSADYDRSVTAQQIHDRSLEDITDGTVILFHEWRPETLQQMPAILAELKRRGCVFLTFSEMARYLGQ